MASRPYIKWLNTAKKEGKEERWDFAGIGIPNRVLLGGLDMVVVKVGGLEKGEPLNVENQKRNS